MFSYRSQNVAGRFNKLYINQSDIAIPSQNQGTTIKFVFHYLYLCDKDENGIGHYYE